MQKPKLRADLTPQERKRAERIGRLPTGQKIKTAWSMRAERFVPSREQHIEAGGCLISAGAIAVGLTEW
jgi:hypothetical protein